MKNMTDINIVLDRSGSMSSCRQSTIDSFNEFLDGQKNGPDEAIVSLFRFDHEYEPVYEGKDVDSAPRLNARNFVPRGSTALMDAIGRTIDAVGARLADTPEYKRPSKVVVVIVTDGGENASKEYGRQRIFEMIKHQQEKYHWTFVFLGANQDAYNESAKYGIHHANTLNFAPTSAGLRKGTEVLTSGMMRARSGPSGQSCSSYFTPAEQAASDALAGKLAAPVPTTSREGTVLGAIHKTLEAHKIPKGTRLNIRKRDLVKSS